MFPVTAVNQQRQRGTGHFLADFGGEPTDSFLVCLPMRTETVWKVGVLWDRPVVVAGSSE